MEFYGSYGAALWDLPESRLNAGITIKAMRGLSGTFADVSDIRVIRGVDAGRNVYGIENGRTNYGISAGHDNWLNKNGSGFKMGDLLKNSRWGVAFDLGVEYLIRQQMVTSVFDDEKFPDYQWKIGISLLDIGRNTYDYSNQSRTAAFLKQNISSDVLQNKFLGIENIGDFNDSLKTIVNEYSLNTGAFRISNPARFVINVDKSLPDNFFINAELSLNLTSLSASDKWFVRESKVAMLTPRWEKKKFGFYLPVQYNRSGTLWFGAAFRAGPLVVGTHNLLNGFAKNKNVNGGGYLAIIIHPANWRRKALNQQYECPIL